MNLMSNCQNVAQQFVVIHADSCTDIWFSLSCVSLALVSDNIIQNPVHVVAVFLVALSTLIYCSLIRVEWFALDSDRPLTRTVQ